MKWFNELIDETSTKSSMRFAMLMSLLFAFAIAESGIYFGRDLNGLAILCGVFVTPVFAKAYQAVKGESSKTP